MEKNLVKQFFSSGNLYLFSKYLDLNTREKILKIWEGRGLDDHVFLMSSGTSSKNNIKCFAISKKSIINNCHSVNSRFMVNSKDIWLASLPFYHIGGLSIFIRAKLSNSKIVHYEEKWDPLLFIDNLKIYNVTITSLVPTQLYDLVKLDIMAPSQLRCVFVGGDFLNSKLASAAKNLGWNIIITYGMTECSSQLASGSLDDIVEGHIPVLTNHKVYFADDKYFLESDAFYAEKIVITKEAFHVEKLPERFELPDDISLVVKNNKQYIKPLGRKDGHLKIKGRLFNFLDLKNNWMNTIYIEGLYGKVEVLLVKSNRDGRTLKAIYLKEIGIQISQIIEKINKQLPPTVQITEYECVSKFNKTELGKMKK